VRKMSTQNQAGRTQRILEGSPELGLSDKQGRQNAIHHK
jgi:hypothetical protein